MASLQAQTRRQPSHPHSLRYICTFQKQSKPWPTGFKEQLITYYVFNFHVVLPIFVACLSPDLICGIKVAVNMEIIVNTVCA